MRVVPVVTGEALPQPGEVEQDTTVMQPIVTQPTEFSPELGLGTAASNVTDVVDALTLGGLLDLGPTSTYYVGANGFGTVADSPVCAAEPVVDVVGLDRKLFDAANAAKARTHFCWGMPGSLQGKERLEFGEFCCCVAPYSCALAYLIIMSWVGPLIICCILSKNLYEAFCKNRPDGESDEHKDMELPPWADAALVMTDKGVIGRRYFGPDPLPVDPQDRPSNQWVPQGLNAIAWSGFDVDRNIRLRPYGGSRCVAFWPSCPSCLPPEDPLVVGVWCGLFCACCRCVCIQPNEPGLYRATIFSKHTYNVGDGQMFSTGSIDLLALARSPDDLRSSLRALKEKYLESLPTTTVEHNFGVWCGRLGVSTFRSDTGRAEVGSVKRCSKAKSYGMQVGDTILELDGQRVDHDAFTAGLAAARRAKRTVRLLIARGG